MNCFIVKVWIVSIQLIYKFYFVIIMACLECMHYQRMTVCNCFSSLLEASHTAHPHELSWKIVCRAQFFWCWLYQWWLPFSNGLYHLYEPPQWCGDHYLAAHICFLFHVWGWPVLQEYQYEECVSILSSIILDN